MMTELLNLVHHYGNLFFGSLWPVVWIMIRIGIILAPILGIVTFLTLGERKVIGWMHARLGPNRVGPLGLIQPIADAIKLLLKEIIVPEKADKVLFWLAPVLAMAPALAAWAVIPFGPDMVLANVNAGLLFIMAITSISIYGIIIGGWASNSKYALMGAVRCRGTHDFFWDSPGFFARDRPAGLWKPESLGYCHRAKSWLFRQLRIHFPVLELDSAFSDFRCLYHLLDSGNRTASVRYDRRGIRNRRRSYG